jgi:hypothetical protein
LKAEDKAKYPFIRAWGYQLGSFKYYIENEIERAIEDKAPERAIYKSGNGEWRTIDDTRDEVVKQQCITWVEAHKFDKYVDDVD